MRSRVGGFTQVELAIVMVVLVILTGLAIPSLNGLEGSRQDSTTARIRAALIHAQLWALDYGVHTWVVCDPRTDRVEAFMENSTAPGFSLLNPTSVGKATRIALPDPLTQAGLILQFGRSGIGIDSADLGGTTEVMFNTQGIPFDGNGALLKADGLVVVTGGATIRITKNTGLIRID